MSTEAAPRPWHREPWPWILMAGPAIVVVAGIATTVLAVSSSDGLVADDYYKQGLAINRVIERDARARALGIAAQVTFNEERDGVRVMLASNAPPPASLRLRIIAARREWFWSAATQREIPSSQLIGWNFPSPRFPSRWSGPRSRSGL